MASSISHHPSRLSLPDLYPSPPPFPFASSTSPSLPFPPPTPTSTLKHASSLTLPKQILGTRLLRSDSFSFPDLGAGEKSKSLRVDAAKRVSTGKSYVLSSTLMVQEGNEEKVDGLCKSIRQWASEKQKDRQSGIKEFECYVDPFEKNVYHFWERYDSFLHMNDIRASSEHTKFMSDVRPFLVGPIALAAYEYQDGQIGHMLNPIGPKGEGGLDDATGQGGGGGGASYKQQSGAVNQGFEEESERAKWGLEQILAKVTGADKEKSESWSLKTLFGGKK